MLAFADRPLRDLDGETTTWRKLHSRVYGEQVASRKANSLLSFEQLTDHDHNNSDSAGRAFRQYSRFQKLYTSPPSLSKPSLLCLDSINFLISTLASLSSTRL